MSRYVEIQQASGDAEAMYPDIAAHLAECPVCHGLHADLLAVVTEPQDILSGPDSTALSQLAAAPPPAAIPQTPVDMLSREEITLRISHVLEAVGQDEPAAGFLLFYDTLHVSQLNLVAIFTLHRSDRPGLYRIEGVISPEQPAVRYKAVLWQDGSPHDAHIDGARLTFDSIALGPQTGHLTVTLAVHSRWRPHH